MIFLQNNSLSLNSYLEYIPNCIICGKKLRIEINGRLPNKLKKYSTTSINLKTKIEDNCLISLNKDYPLTIDLISSEIFEGRQFIIDLMTGWIYINKLCSTCHFKISAIYNRGFMEKLLTTFPQIHLYSEDLSYTMTGGHKAEIHKIYYDDSTGLKDRTLIHINGKLLPNFPFQLNKFNHLNELNQRLFMIRTFQ